MKHVIIGNGVAGASAAQSIRRFDETADITVITEEDLPFYSRMRLPEFVAGTIEEKKLIIHKDAWYEENRISLITNQRVASIDSGSKQIILGANAHMSYDKLLVATGGRATILPLPGIEKNGVFTLRNIQDARKIRAYAENSESAIIIGGGVLGLEIANALLKLGKKVTVIEFFDRLLPRQMDAEGSSILMNKLETLGMHFVMGVRTEEISGGEMVEGVRLRNGLSINGQMVIISAGMKPEVSLFHNLQIQPGRGVSVNDNMATGLPDIYAAGDAAEHRQRICGIWSAAEKQGEVAGLNMAGGNSAYDGTAMSYYLSVAGIDLFSAGEIDAEGRLPSFVYENRGSGIYRKIVVRDNTVAGGIFCGDTAGRKEVISAIQEKRPVEDLNEILEKLDMKPLPERDN
jgi:nitrite reductase (NADH) large subunit